MKKLISEQQIREARNAGRFRLEYDGNNTLLTPQAQTVARELQVELVDISAPAGLSHGDMKRVVEKVLEQLPSSKYSRARIEEVLKEVLRQK